MFENILNLSTCTGYIRHHNPHGLEMGQDADYDDGYSQFLFPNLGEPTFLGLFHECVFTPLSLHSI